MALPAILSKLVPQLLPLLFDAATKKGAEKEAAKIKAKDAAVNAVANAPVSTGLGVAGAVCISVADLTTMLPGLPEWSYQLIIGSVYVVSGLLVMKQGKKKQ